MPDDLNDTLGKLTPSAGGLDAGAMLYEAGRASVPSPWRAWALASLLALTQALTLLALLMPTSPDAPHGGLTPRRPPEAITPPDSAGQPLLTVGQLPPEPPAESLPPDRPPLRAIDLSSFD